MPSVNESRKTSIANAHLAQVAIDEDRLPRRPLDWLMLMVAAAVVGSLTGLVGAAFRWCLERVSAWRGELTNHGIFAGWHGIGWIAPMVLCSLGAGVGCYLTRKFAPQTAGSGIPRVEAVIRNHIRPAGALILPVKFVGGILCIGSGLALGREGPTVQMGGTVGRLLGDGLKRLTPEPWTLIAAGAGAGLAVAFNAPLAAAVFVVEELVRRFSARIFAATLVSTICGTVVLRLFLGNISSLATPRLAALPSDVLPGYLLLGLLAGIFGVVFNKSLLGAIQLSDSLGQRVIGGKGAIVGAAAGLVVWFAPTAVGGGETLANLAMNQRLAWHVIGLFLLVRFVLTMTSYASGAPGGIFAPLLALGALLGNGFAVAGSALLHRPLDPASYAIVAMAACFTAIVRSPLTAVVLLLEMTGSWPLILPMMAASVTAYAVPELLGSEPIYEALRERDESVEQEEKAKAAERKIAQSPEK